MSSSRPAPGDPARRRSRSRKSWLLLVVVLLLINLPLLHSAWTRSQVERSGVDVIAEVRADTVTGEGAGERYFVGFRLPERIGGETIEEDDRGWTVQVDQETYERATREGDLPVRVLPDQPAAYAVDGQVRSSAPLVSTLFLNGLVLAVAGLLWRFRGRMRPELTLLATQDVERCEPDSLIERLDDGRYVVRGEVAELGEDHVVLDVGNRHVVVELDGHANPVGHQEPAQARGRMIG